MLGSVPRLEFGISLAMIFVAYLMAGKPMSTNFTGSGSLLSVAREIKIKRTHFHTRLINLNSENKNIPYGFKGIALSILMFF